MSIGSDYPTPVIVNGFSCKNCTDVANAKKHIDPEHPKSGPYGITAKDDPTVKTTPPVAVMFGGSLSSLNDKQAAAGTQAGAQPSNAEVVTATVSGIAIGAQLDITA